MVVAELSVTGFIPYTTKNMVTLQMKLYFLPMALILLQDIQMKKGHGINLRNHGSGYSALMYACLFSKYPDVILLLLKSGARTSMSAWYFLYRNIELKKNPFFKDLLKAVEVPR